MITDMIVTRELIALVSKADLALADLLTGYSTAKPEQVKVVHDSITVFSRRSKMLARIVRLKSAGFKRKKDCTEHNESCFDRSTAAVFQPDGLQGPHSSTCAHGFAAAQGSRGYYRNEPALEYDNWKESALVDGCWSMPMSGDGSHGASRGTPMLAVERGDYPSERGESRGYYRNEPVASRVHQRFQ